MIDREKFLGHVSEPRVAVVEEGFLKFFAEATADPDPIHFDAEAARAAGHRAIIAPPTYLFSLAMGCLPKSGELFDPVNGLGLDMARVLHGEQAFTYYRPIYAGDRITLTTTTSEIYDKKGGALEFVVQLTQAVNEAGDLCAEMRFLTVVRHG